MDITEKTRAIPPRTNIVAVIKPDTTWVMPQLQKALSGLPNKGPLTVRPKEVLTVKPPAKTTGTMPVMLLVIALASRTGRLAWPRQPAMVARLMTTVVFIQRIPAALPQPALPEILAVLIPVIQAVLQPVADQLVLLPL